jgi:predicted Fe-Mo cluster-binding NifX family protein
MIFKVYCEYYIKAKDLEKAEEFVIDEMSSGDFKESHLIIEESELPKGEGVFNE